jgi:lipopolysaccharide transport system ATP-binding protein
MKAMQGMADSPQDVSIRVRGVSKYYAIYDVPRDRLKQMLMPRLRRLLGRPPKSYHRTFWALQDIDFEIARGETVAIIGRNGAGKSTLLQIITGTLAPSQGTVSTQGRIAALLELGAGFNPEFTGRENVYLNAAILGLGRDDVARRFEEIADFAGIGNFIDQPVRTYSSGMYVRLAFAVQACVDPDILIVDEALAVGDVGFQYKCFKRMEALKRRGVTILMVTHSTSSVLEYADRCIVLDGGRVVKDTRDVLAAVLAYEKGMLQQVQVRAAGPRAGALTPASAEALRAIQERDRNLALGEKRFGTARAIIETIELLRGDGSPLAENPLIRPNEAVIFRFGLAASEVIDEVVLGVSISGVKGGDIWGDNNLNAGQALRLSPGRQVVEYEVHLPLSAGEYLLHCGLASLAGGVREELDQRRPVGRLRFWSAREQVGVVYAPVQVSIVGGEGT